MPGPVPLHSVVNRDDSTVTLLSPRPTRRNLVIYNNSNEWLCIMYGPGVTAEEFTIKIPPNYWGTMPWGGVYTGLITGVWLSAGSGDAQLTELIG